MSRGDAGDQRCVEQSAAAPERTVGHRLDAAFLVLGQEFILREARVHLDLVDRRHDTCLGLQPVELPGGEVGDADRPDLLPLAQLDHRAPGVDVAVELRERPVDEVPVHLLDVEPEAGLLKGGERFGIAVVAARQFRDYEHLLTRYLARRQCASDACFIAVGRTRVDKAVARRRPSATASSVWEPLIGAVPMPIRGILFNQGDWIGAAVSRRSALG